jgi:hypothetical protein
LPTVPDEETPQLWKRPSALTEPRSNLSSLEVAGRERSGPIKTPDIGFLASLMIADLLQLLRIPHPASDPIAVASTNGATDRALSVTVGETADIK